MADYRLLTDLCCDVPPAKLEEWGVAYAQLTFHFDGSEREYVNTDMSAAEFYRQMREGRVFQTAAINIDAYRVLFEPVLQQGEDILYIGFSSGLSSSVGAAQIAAEELEAAYPGRRVRVVDSLCASAGQGLLLYLAVERKKRGVALEELGDWVEERRLHLCHWFTVADLSYLKRGGRVSAASCFAATVLDIKPVMHMDNDGHLINVHRVRGRKQSLRALAERYAALAEEPKGGLFFISHGDSIEDAETLAAMLERDHGAHAGLITDVGPVIGAHSGPGTIALFFVGRER